MFVGHEIALGSAQTNVHDLSSCGGGGCVAASVADRELDETDAPMCQMMPADTLEVVWRQQLYDLDTSEPRTLPDCGPKYGPCRLDNGLLRIVSATDGSLWVQGSIGPNITDQLTPQQDESAAGVWLGHYTADGTELVTRVIESERLQRGELIRYEANLLPGPAGDVMIPMRKTVATEGASAPRATYSIQRYDAEAHPHGPPLEFTGVADDSGSQLAVAVADDDTMAVKIGTRLVLLERGGVRWTRTVPSSSGGVLIDRRHEILLWDGEFSRGAHDVLRHFDREGRLQWQRTLSANLDQGTFVLDADGNTLRAGFPFVGTPLAPHMQGTAQLVHRISAGGESMFLVSVTPGVQPGFDLGGGGGSALAVDASGHTWLAGPGFYPSVPSFVLAPDAPDAGDPGANAAVEPFDHGVDQGGTVLYEIAADSSWCRVYLALGWQGIDQLVRAPGGGFYFSAQSGFGLLRKR